MNTSLVLVGAGLAAFPVVAGLAWLAALGGGRIARAAWGPDVTVPEPEPRDLVGANPTGRPRRSSARRRRRTAKKQTAGAGS